MTSCYGIQKGKFFGEYSGRIISIAFELEISKFSFDGIQKKVYIETRLVEFRRQVLMHLSHDISITKIFQRR